MTTYSCMVAMCLLPLLFFTTVLSTHCCILTCWSNGKLLRPAYITQHEAVPTLESPHSRGRTHSASRGAIHDQKLLCPIALGLSTCMLLPAVAHSNQLATAASPIERQCKIEIPASAMHSLP